MKPLLVIVDNYDSFTYNLVQAFAQLDVGVEVVRNDQSTVAELEDAGPDGLVISPGPGRPDDAGISCQAVAAFGGRVPVLGVCLGHQCIAQVFGASVVRAPSPVHGKTTRIRHDGSGVFAGLPQGFLATRYHSLAADQDTIGEDLVVTAVNDEGVVMGLRHRELGHLEGVQFHPESILTTEGPRLLENFARGLRAGQEA